MQNQDKTIFLDIKYHKYNRIVDSFNSFQATQKCQPPNRKNKTKLKNSFHRKSSGVMEYILASICVPSLQNLFLSFPSKRAPIAKAVF